jgi:hypothetical protein
VTVAWVTSINTFKQDKEAYILTDRNVAQDKVGELLNIVMK